MDPRNKDQSKQDNSGNSNPVDQTSRREGGDDAISETSSQDARADEKVIVNEQRENKTVNAPSQTAAHTSEMEGSEDDVL